jgi:hypothetical protein
MDFLLSKEFWEGMQAFVAFAAIAVGGVWFLRTRRRYPKAHVSHEAWSWKTGAGERIVRVVIGVENRGEVLLQLGRAIVRVHQVTPLSEEVLGAVQAARKAETGQMGALEWRPFHEQAIDWKALGGELEPGEWDELSCHFVLPEEVECVIVYSFLENRQKAGKGQFGWIKTSVHVL